MKKQLLLLSMVSIVALSGCDVSQIVENDKQVIVKIGDTAYTADDLFEHYSNTSAGASAYYNAVYDVLISEVQPNTNAIENAVSADMDSFQEAARKSASDNGTSYTTELSKSLEAKGVENLEELQELYYLDAKKEAYKESYYDSNLNDSLLEEYITNYAPYHIRHILVKNSADSSLYKGKISKDDAINLADTVKRLAEGKETFGVIAQSTAANGDTGSAAIYGDVGIMDTTTSFVSEFKYSIYQYDALYNSYAASSVAKFNANQDNRKVGNTTVKGTHLIPESVDTQLLKDNINRIPYDVFTQLKEYAGYEKNDQGLQVQDGKEEYFPRNYLYNTFINNHNLGVITKGNSGINSNRFQTIEGLSADGSDANKVLCDEEKRPILVSKAGTGAGDSGYQGVHFIIIQKSAFTSKIEDLKEYYDNKVYSTSEDVSKIDSYVTFIKSDRKTYTERAEKIKSNVKGFDSYIDYRIFEQALEESGATLNEEAADIINRYIEANRQSTAYSAVESYEKSWKSYMDLLNVQIAVEDLKLSSTAIDKAYGKSFNLLTK